MQVALKEDVSTGDITTNAIVSDDAWLQGHFVAKAAGIIAGLKVAELVFQELDNRVQVEFIKRDGETVRSGQIVAKVSGPGRALLSGERVALNFLQRMSGIATMTCQFVKAVKGTQAKILDTRKTAPSLRLLDKWAVQLGGGHNHRFGLYDMILIKENHIAAAGGLRAAVTKVREAYGEKYSVEIEVKNLKQLREAVELPVDRILLDNMSLHELHEAVRLVAGRIPLEVSGNVTLDNVAAIARTGVDFISVGRLTHSAPALDISFLIERQQKD